MSKKYKVAVIIGRFEPIHNGHVSIIKDALKIADHIHILIGSAFQPRTPKNPFTYAERRLMIKNAFQYIGASDRFTISPIQDHSYNNSKWICDVQDAINTYTDVADSDVAILGHEKDDSSWYLRAFPHWAFVPLNGYSEYESRPIDATKIRELLFEGHLNYVNGAVLPVTYDSLFNFIATDEYKLLIEEYECIKKTKKDWEVAPYPPIFVTTDAVVIQGGHILLVKRKFVPGKGLWALPGGFVGQNETLQDSCIRELREETKLKVPVPVLTGSITYKQEFDKPDRSLRGRTITHAYLIELTGGSSELPKVKGSDDAEEAKWFTIREVESMSDKLFEDHYSIITTMLGHAR